MRSYVIIGCGRFGSAVARTLYDLGHEVMVIDRDEDIVNEVAPYVTFAVQADITDEKLSKELGLRNFDVAVVAIGADLESSIMATLVVKELGIKTVVAKALTDMHGKVLEKIGADRIIYPEIDMGIRVAHNIASTNILEFVELSSNYSIIEITSIKEWIGKSLGQIKLANKYKVNIIAIKKKDSIDISPNGEVVIEEDDILVVIGNINDIRKLEEKVGE